MAAAIYRTIGSRVETLFDNSISAINERATGVLVSFEHGAAREFDLVIGADGLHSTVRALVFGPERRFEKPLGYRVATFDVEAYRPRDELIFVTYTTPGRQVGRFALRGDRTIFSFLFSGEKLTGPIRAMQRSRRPFCIRFSRMPAGNARRSSTRWIKSVTCIMIASVKSEWTAGPKDA